MPQAHNGEIAIEYETIGDPANPPLLLIMGLTAQLTAWEEEFCQLLVDRGLFVIRFDNRDAGLSSKSSGEPPDMVKFFAAYAAGKPFEHGSYSLSDMAADALAVLDDLGIDAAHVAGASMGGMIAQQLSIEYPDRVLSLCSIMSTTGAPGVGGSTPEAMEALLAPPVDGREASIERGVHTSRVISGPLFDADRARKRAAATYDRSFWPAGGAFQLAAIAMTGDRTESLKELDVPTLVIHGAADPLIQPSGGEATAAAIDGAKLLVLDKMGHDLPPALWGEITSVMAENALGAG